MASFLLLLVYGGRSETSIPLTLAAAAAGYVCSTARIVGAPLAALPVVWAWNDLWPAIKARIALGSLLLKSWRFALVSAATAFGTISFFVFCEVRFGYWDLYMRPGLPDGRFTGRITPLSSRLVISTCRGRVFKTILWPRYL